MDKLAISEKYALTISEASAYFNIGDKKLRKFLSEHQGEKYILMNGSKMLLKRIQFEKIIDELSAI